MIDSANWRHLRDRVEELCLIFGSFTLSTGATSDFYFDCKRAMLDGEALGLSAEAFLKEIDAIDNDARAIDGLTLGADFIVAAVIQRAFQTGHQLVKGSIVRKEVKIHGTKNRVENELESGTKIIVVDDVITTGSSTRTACIELEKEGYKIVVIVALVNREAGGVESLANEFNE